MPRILNRVLDLYGKYRRIMWISSLAGGMGIPLAGYGFGVVHLIQHRKTEMADNPELANELTTPTPWDWLAAKGGIIGHVMFGVITLGFIAVMLLIVLQLVRFVSARTELSGVDEKLQRQERQDTEDDEESALDDADDFDLPDSFPDDE